MCVLLDSFGASNSQCKRKSAITLIGIKTVTIDCNIGQYDGHYCSADDENISTDLADNCRPKRYEPNKQGI
jgi:hypothetical protein